MRMAWPGPSMA